MSLVAFDTLKFANQLQAGNFTHEQAQAMTSAVVEAMAGAELATKSDLVAVRGDISAVKAELKADIAAVKAEAAANKAELKADIAAVKAEAAANKAELKADIAALDQRMTTGFRDIEQRMTIKLGGMMMAIAILIVAAIKYLPPTH